MKKKNKLINKIKYLLKKAKMPRHLNWYGPKIYTFWQHALSLLVRSMFRLSYRRTKQTFELFGLKCGSKSTLAYQAKHIPTRIWQELLRATNPITSEIAAVDSTGIAGSNPSWHYVRRIDRKDPISRFYKFSMLVDVKSRKILSIRLRSKPRHDVKDVKYLIKQTSSKCKIVVLDKGYDAEWIHRYFALQNIWSIAPLRKNIKKGMFRKKLAKKFPKQIYNQRNIVECVFSAIKRKFGNSVSSLKIRSARTEMYCRSILHNIFSIFINYLGLSLFFKK